MPPGLSEEVARALAEDIGPGDVTAALIPAETQARATLITREEMILCGSAWLAETFRQIDPRVSVDWRAREGDRVAAGATLCELRGPARAILTGERCALNFLQTLSGTATTTRRHAQAVAGTNCRILDTRKTVPGLRLAQKYAVRCGGGHNHRLGLYDRVLIKENHIVAAGSIPAAIHAARRLVPGIEVEVEVETLAEFAQALAEAPDYIMLDEFSLDDMRAAVQRRNDAHSRSLLEASGGVDLDGLAKIAATGVDFVSIGALTKHVRAIDLSMRFLAL
ncbi:MAG: carboxylating nicotinate-nucleotide diphosphorylase [Proteobacteria bacterium]|nr:carboxylating nicotinate-nucleotide diphosphorylase [Pseudomonadota bacterium]MBK9251122.1 carboxylating nicotinate-nucleotide diphosphorylase [Pseudomonadota bacterium]